VRVVSVGRDGNPTVPSLDSKLDARGFPIQIIKVFASRFAQHVFERYHATK